MVEGDPFLIRNFMDNEFFWAGIFLGAIAFARNLPLFVFMLLVRRLCRRITVYSEDTDLFNAVNHWIFHCGLVSNSRNYRLHEVWSGYDQWSRYEENGDIFEGPVKAGDNFYDLEPATGSHFGWVEGNPVYVTRTEAPSEGQGQRRENLTVWVPVWSNLVQRMVDACVALNKPAPDQIVVHLLLAHREALVLSRPKLNDRMLVFQDGLYERLRSDLATFLESRDKYRGHNRHWHRGYGFFGSPGTGKTSMIMLLASEFEMPIYRLNLKTMSDSSFIHQIQGISGRGIVVFEEFDQVVDAAVNPPPPVKTIRDRPVPADSFGVSYSALLNVFDGLDTPEGMVVIVTSNHKDRIDSAILRAGRIDVAVDFEVFDNRLAAELLNRYYADEDWNHLLDEDEVGAFSISPAQLRNIVHDSPDPASCRHQLLSEVGLK